MLQTFLTFLSDGISAVSGWLDTLGEETIGVSLLGVMISFVTLYTIIRFLRSVVQDLTHRKKSVCRFLTILQGV